MKSLLGVFFAAVCAVFGLVGGAAAQNVVVNGTFNGDITTGWTQVAFQAGPSFDNTRDCCADANPGSLRTVPTNNGNWIAIQQCDLFSAASNPNFQLSAWVQLNSVVGTAQLTNATIVVQFYTTNDCNPANIVGTTFAVGPSGTGIATGPWAFYELRTQATPIGALSAQVRVSIRRGSTIDASFDHVLLAPDVAFVDAIFKNDFE